MISNPRRLGAWLLALAASASLAGASASLVGASAPLAAAAPASWPQWRGPARDGTAPGFAAPERWPAALARRWSVPVGLGHASPVVAGNRVFVHAREGEREVVLALESASGKVAWRDAYDAPYQMNSAATAHGPGPKSTPVVSGNRLVTFGISGILSCYDTNSGKLLWRKRPVQDQPTFGTAMSPIVEGSHVIAHVGGHDAGALTAFDLATGEARWKWTGGAPAYASPVIATFSGVRQLVTQSRTHVIGVSVADGRLLWEIPFTTSYDQNSITPLVIGDLVVYSGLSKGIEAVRPQLRGGAWTAEPAWRNADVPFYMSTPIVDGTTLYGLSHRNRGQFVALDARTGQTLWTTKGREADNAALVRTGGVLVALTTNSELIVFKPSTTAFEEVRRYDVADSPTWAHPALAGTQIIVKDERSVTAWDVGA